MLSKSAFVHVPYDDTLCLHQLFERQTLRTPGTTAVSDDRKTSWSYEDLNTRAEELAAVLAELMLGPEDLVAVWLERTVGMVAVVLGIMKCGSGYVPISMLFPPERRQYVIENSGAQSLVVSASLLPKMREEDLRHQCIFVDEGGR
jgi:non-ribosomal peptide synthetase component F